MQAPRTSSVRCLLAMIMLTVVFGCAEHVTGVPLERDLRQVGCEYLQRCFPGILGAFPGGTLEGCMSANPCPSPSTSTIALTDASACVDFLKHDVCSLTLAQPGALWSLARGPLVFGGVALVAPHSSPCRERALPATGERAAVGQRCVRREFSCVDGSGCMIDSPPRFVGSAICGQCVAYARTGATCAPNDLCAEGPCLNGSCLRWRDQGEACTADDECVNPRQCTNRRCASEPSGRADGAALNETCAGGIAPDECGADWTLTCIDGRCVPRRDLGEGCQDESHCRAWQSCRGGRCVERTCHASLGDFCDSHSGCAPELVCVGGTTGCTTPPPSDPRAVNGTRCSDHFECESGNCSRDISAFCNSNGSCAIPTCDRCGVCAAPADNHACE